jgi:hypothetical protein
MSRLRRLKALPWVGLAQAGIAFNARWRTLSERDRARLSQLVADSKGWPGKLNAKDRVELRKLLGKLDLKAMGGDLLPLLRGSKRKRGK